MFLISVAKFDKKEKKWLEYKNKKNITWHCSFQQGILGKFKEKNTDFKYPKRVQVIVV